MAIKKPATKPVQKPSKAIVPAKKQEVGAALDLLADSQEMGNNFGRNDLLIPRITILQSMSPQVKKSDPLFIKGAEEGMIFHTTTGELWSSEEGILVIPVSYRLTHIEWKDRTQGGGFVRDHGVDPSIVNQTSQDKETGVRRFPNGNILSIVGEYFVFLFNEEQGTFEPAVLGMAGSQGKKSRRWNTMINQRKVDTAQGPVNPPMFYCAYRLTTVPEKNDKGSWFGWAIAHEADVPSLKGGTDAYQSAKIFRKQVDSGAVQAAAPTENSGGHSTESEDSPM